ncbi:MAG: hypothetical protein CMK07_09690 [Ponticaulis sp.]|nr:hypothetical protein [Ponticaulis sp.]
MFRSLIAIAGLGLFMSLPTTAQTADPHLEKGQFCIREKAGVDRRASEESAAIFSSLHMCGTFCTDAGYLKGRESESRISDLVSRCEAAFSELPAEIQARFGAAPDTGDMATAVSLRGKADECRSLAIQYPRLANDRRDPSFNKCAIACDSAAQNIETAGYDVANYAASCEQEYTGAKARISGLTRSR